MSIRKGAEAISLIIPGVDSLHDISNFYRPAETRAHHLLTLIGSAERILLLPEGATRPANEFQIRPFLKLEPEESPGKWKSVVDAAGPGKVTSKIVTDTLGLAKRRRKRRGATAANQKEEVDQLLDSLRAALNGKDGRAMKELGKLEKVLRMQGGEFKYAARCVFGGAEIRGKPFPFNPARPHALGI